MNFETIQYFLDVIEAGSYKEAAEQKKISVSAVSQKIRTIEKEYETKLVNRKNGKIELTAAGTIFAQKGRRILNDYQSALNDIKRMKKAIIYIGLVSYVDPEFVVDLLQEFAEHYPQISIRIRVESLPIMIEKFKSGIYHALILGKTDIVRVRGYDYIDLFTFHPYLLVPHDHELVDRECISARELRDKQIAIIFQNEWPEGFRTICQAIEREAGNIKWEITENYQELVSEVELEGLLGLGYKEDWVIKFEKCKKIPLNVKYEDYGIMMMRTDLNNCMKEFYNDQIKH